MNKNQKFLRFWFMFFIFGFLFFILQNHWSLAAAEGVKIAKIESTRDRGFDYLDIYTTGNVKAQGLLLEDQLIITFPGVEIAEGIEISSQESKRIKGIHLEEITGEAVQVVVDLKKDIDYEIVNVFGRNKSVVEICDRLDYTAQLFAAWEAANLKTKGDVLKTFKYEPAIAAQDQSLRGKTVVVDPGHGGRDPGAFSLSGVPEKYLNLQTARKLADILSSAGATVYLTRNEDRTSNLKDIVDFANKSRADIFICIHYNFNYNRGMSGTETYYYNRGSRGLALAIHQSFIGGIKRKDRGLRRAMFYTVHHTEMPAVLLEPVYLSNPEEGKLAAAPSFQYAVAKDIAKGVKAYFRSRVR